MQNINVQEQVRIYYLGVIRHGSILRSKFKLLLPIWKTGWEQYFVCIFFTDN